MNRLGFTIAGILVSVAIALALVSVLKEHRQGRDPVPVTQQAAQNDDRPQMSTFKDCPMAIVDGVEIELGQECMYTNGKLVGVRIKAGGGWVMAE